MMLADEQVMLTDEQATSASNQSNVNNGASLKSSKRSGGPVGRVTRKMSKRDK